jgi:hypothetical protein
MAMAIVRVFMKENHGGYGVVLFDIIFVHFNEEQN